MRMTRPMAARDDLRLPAAGRSAPCIDATLGAHARKIACSGGRPNTMPGRRMVLGFTGRQSYTQECFRWRILDAPYSIRLNPREDKQ